MDAEKRKTLKKKRIDFWIISCLFILFKYPENAKKLVLWVEFSTGGIFSVSDSFMCLDAEKRKKKKKNENYESLWFECVVLSAGLNLCANGEIYLDVWCGFDLH